MGQYKIEIDDSPYDVIEKIRRNMQTVYFDIGKTYEQISNWQSYNHKGEMKMNDNKHNEYLNRLSSEIDDLSGKLNRLNKFIKTDKFSSLTYANQHLLTWQLEVMNQYQQILTVRYELNGNKKGK